MGRSIVECPIPFDLNRPLTEKEKEEVLRYCESDVAATIEIYKLREESYFATKEELIAMTGGTASWRKNTGSISAGLLTCGKCPEWERLRVPDELWRNVPDLPEAVWEMWEQWDGEQTNRSVKPKQYGCDISFGMGGLHGVNSEKRIFEDVHLLDVSSMYPSIILRLNALGEGTEEYRKIRDERLRIKHSEPLRAKALKLILNSVYGNFKSRFSTLYNPYAAGTVCIYGQIVLFDLCGRLYAEGYTLANINTDGVAFTDRSGAGDVYQAIRKEWEEDYGLELEEFTNFKEIADISWYYNAVARRLADWQNCIS